MMAPKMGDFDSKFGARPRQTHESLGGSKKKEEEKNHIDSQKKHTPGIKAEITA